MSALLASVWPYLLAAGAAVIAIFSAYAKGRSAGTDTQKAKEAEARAKNLDDIRRSNDAAAAARVDELSDPNNRDNR